MAEAPSAQTPEGRGKFPAPVGCTCLQTVKIIMAQLSGSGRGALGSFNTGQYTTLCAALEEVPFRDGDEWLEHVMHKDPSLAMRVMEVREAYCSEGFEWDQLQRLATTGTQAANVRLLRQQAEASLSKSLEDAPVQGRSPEAQTEE